MAGRGFASMDPKRQKEIASMGGRASGGQFGRGNDASAAGRMGAAAQSREAKARGGRNSHRGGS